MYFHYGFRDFFDEKYFREELLSEFITEDSWIGKEVWGSSNFICIPLEMNNDGSFKEESEKVLSYLLSKDRELLPYSIHYLGKNDRKNNYSLIEDILKKNHDTNSELKGGAWGWLLGHREIKYAN